jgi:hypothetical protein
VRKTETRNKLIRLKSACGRPHILGPQHFTPDYDAASLH